MNAAVRLPEPTSFHPFTVEEAERLREAGILPPKGGVKLIEGRLVFRSTDEPFRFTLEAVRQMIEAEILDPDARVELIDGELIDMAPQNAPHMYAKQMLMRFFARHLGPDVDIHVEGTLSLAPGVSPSPDLFLHAVTTHVDAVLGPDVLLLIEVADRSLLRDLHLKAALYARHGVGDYWVVDAYGRRIFVHRQPGPEGYRQIIEPDRDGQIAPLAFPDLVIQVADLPRPD